MSQSPCSVPRWLRWLVPKEPTILWPCCDAHDLAYRVGGNEAERRAADRALYTCLIAAGMARPLAFKYWLAVRTFGGPFGNFPLDDHTKHEL